MKPSLLRLAALSAITVGIAACSTPDAANPRTVASARLTAATGVPQPYPQSPVQGSLEFSQVRDVVSVNGTLTGLKPNARHAFHVHEKGDCSKPDFSSAGSHFNPTSQPHGRASKPQHHAGDSDNLVANAEGTATVNAHFNGVVLGGGASNDIIGKAIVVHADPDDYTSQPSGNAGSRIACGVINAD